MTDLKFTDEYWAVFNGHVEDAATRALRLVELRYGEADEHVQQLFTAQLDGIMSIFGRPPDKATLMFATLCWVFANGLDKREPETKRDDPGVCEDLTTVCAVD